MVLAPRSGSRARPARQTGRGSESLLPAPVPRPPPRREVGMRLRQRTELHLAASYAGTPKRRRVPGHRARPAPGSRCRRVRVGLQDAIRRSTRCSFRKAAPIAAAYPPWPDRRTTPSAHRPATASPWPEIPGRSALRSRSAGTPALRTGQQQHRRGNDPHGTPVGELGEVRLAVEDVGEVHHQRQLGQLRRLERQPPITIQRCAPIADRPMAGTNVSATSGRLTATSGSTARRTRRTAPKPRSPRSACRAPPTAPAGGRTVADRQTPCRRRNKMRTTVPPDRCR